MNRQFVENNLEAYLSGSLDAAGQAEFQRALTASDAETRALIERMTRQSRLIQAALRPPSAQLDPGAGFYARVMDRIESQRAVSPFWSALLEPLFFRRLVMASATLLLLLGFTLFTGGPDDIAVAADADQAPHVIMAGEPEPLLVTTPASTGAGRDVVLGDLTTYQE